MSQAVRECAAAPLWSQPKPKYKPVSDTEKVRLLEAEPEDKRTPNRSPNITEGSIKVWTEVNKQRQRS